MGDPSGKLVVSSQKQSREGSSGAKAWLDAAQSGQYRIKVGLEIPVNSIATFLLCKFILLSPFTRIPFTPSLLSFAAFIAFHPSLFFFFISNAIAIAIVASPHPDRGALPWELALGIVKLWMSMTASGEKVSFLDPECRLELNEDFGELGFSENELVPINVSFIGKCHVVVEENPSFGQFNSPEGKKSGMRRISSGGNMRGEEYGDVDDVIVPESGSSGSLLDRLMSDLYQYFANRTNPSGDRASRRQRRREKERQGRRKWEPEHFVKIVNCSPTPSRPL
ncbi:hypothetical protein LguiA_023243 [Lonicera macranthoides]